MGSAILLDLEVGLDIVVDKLNEIYARRSFRFERKLFGFTVYETDKKTKKESTVMQMHLKRVDGAADDLQVFPSEVSGERKRIYKMIDNIIETNICSSNINKVVIDYSPTPFYGTPTFTSPIKVLWMSRYNKKL